ncbi:MAG TPA: hypothetical protein DC053_21405 [Lachnoclostridium sp.]|nr:hypothetical protein [Lachnoclostridium sp.]
MILSRARNKLKKTLAIITVTSLLASLIIGVSFAGIGNGNANGGGAVDAGNDPVYAHKFMAYIDNQGYRLSIVDKDGLRVANSVDKLGKVENLS